MENISQKYCASSKLRCSKSTDTLPQPEKCLRIYKSFITSRSYNQPHKVLFIRLSMRKIIKYKPKYSHKILRFILFPVQKKMVCVTW